MYTIYGCEIYEIMYIIYVVQFKFMEKFKQYWNKEGNHENVYINYQNFVIEI